MEKEDEVEDLGIKDVAKRLGIAVRTLQKYLATDQSRLPHERCFQHHFFIGRQKRWNEAGYQRLKEAIVKWSNEKNGHAEQKACTSLSGMGIGTSTVPLLSTMDEQSACDDLQAFAQAALKKKQNTSKRGSRQKSGNQSSQAKGQVLSFHAQL